jgi:hypothetical protein
MKMLHIDSIRAAAAERPAGYVKHLLERGQVVRGDDGEPVYVAFTDTVWDELVGTYSTGEPPRPSAGGVGTELKKLLAGWPFRIVATANCSCNTRAAEMDRLGVEWCEQNQATIVGWMGSEARKRGLPFLDAVGRLLVRRAIANARRAVG